ncbi:MAG: hypothetical protein HRT53_04305 [Colwellia sp.]|nr:hypothetical protein [Colwellia sp.]
MPRNGHGTVTLPTWSRYLAFVWNKKLTVDVHGRTNALKDRMSEKGLNIYVHWHDTQGSVNAMKAWMPRNGHATALYRSSTCMDALMP